MPNEHSGHRSRMRERFLHTHFDGFEDHQILEMILFYVYPRTDTNPLAHRLINKFGSIAAVLDSPVDALIDAGLTKNAATFLVMLPDISRIYLNDRNNNTSKIINFDDLGGYFAPKFIGRDEEAMILLLTDAKGKEVYCGVVSKGSFHSSEAPVRKIIDLAMRYNAATAVIAHNHPSGVALPSIADLRATKSVSQALDLIGVMLYDHIIVSDEDFVSLRETELCKDFITNTLENG